MSTSTADQSLCPNTALLVIDAQESFRQRDYWNEDIARPYLKQQQRLIDGARDLNIPIAQIFHIEDGTFFDEARGFVKTINPLDIVPDAQFKKRRHSALVGSGLDVWLIRHGIQRLIVSGIRTEQCCETTTRHLSDTGYEVDFVTEATLTFTMTHADGTVFSAEDIKRRTELVLSGRFAQILTVDEVLAVPATAEAA